MDTRFYLNIEVLFKIIKVFSDQFVSCFDCVGINSPASKNLYFLKL